ncbi:MAG: Integral membrane protein, partial [uncultured Rubrobacteraceae bacterium]
GRPDRRDPIFRRGRYLDHAGEHHDARGLRRWRPRGRRGYHDRLSGGLRPQQAGV